MKVVGHSIIGTPDDAILTSTFAVHADDAQPNDNPVLITFSVDPGQHDPEDAVEALRELADAIEDGIDAVDGGAF